MTLAQKLTIELIRYEISSTPVNPELLEAVNDEVLEAVYKFATEQDIAYIVGSSLFKLNLLSGDARAAFFNEQLSSIYRYESIKHELESISDLFEAECVSFIPLKGSVIRELYPKPEMRMSCDIDILIHREDLKRARMLVESKLAYKYHLKGDHDISFFSPSGVHLELHFTLHERDAKQKSLLDKVWDYAELSRGYSYRYNMTNEFFVFYHIFHISKHFITGGCGIKQFLDLWIMTAKLNYDKGKLDYLFEQYDFKKFANAVIRASNTWFGNEVRDDLTTSMEDYVFNSGTFGTLENQVAISKTRTGSRFKEIWFRIFMPYNKLKFLYPIIVKYPVLTPIFEVVRWCRIIFKDKMKKQMAIIKYNATITEEKQNEVAKLMKNLELM